MRSQTVPWLLGYHEVPPFVQSDLDVADAALSPPEPMTERAADAIVDFVQADAEIRGAQAFFPQAKGPEQEPHP